MNWFLFYTKGKKGNRDFDHGDSNVSVKKPRLNVPLYFIYIFIILFIIVVHEMIFNVIQIFASLIIDYVKKNLQSIL